jgi:hypothetical protein
LIRIFIDSEKLLPGPRHTVKVASFL